MLGVVQRWSDGSRQWQLHYLRLMSRLVLELRAAACEGCTPSAEQFQQCAAELDSNSSMRCTCPTHQNIKGWGITCANSVVRMAVTCRVCSSFRSAFSVTFLPTMVVYLLGGRGTWHTWKN